MNLSISYITPLSRKRFSADDTAAERADREPVRTGIAEHMVAHLATAAAVHVLDDDGRIARDVFAQERMQGFYPVIADSSRRGTGDDR